MRALLWQGFRAGEHANASWHVGARTSAQPLCSTISEFSFFLESSRPHQEGGRARCVLVHLGSFVLVLPNANTSTYPSSKSAGVRRLRLSLSICAGKISVSLWRKARGHSWWRPPYRQRTNRAAPRMLLNSKSTQRTEIGHRRSRAERARWLGVCDTNRTPLQFWEPSLYVTMEESTFTRGIYSRNRHNVKDKRLHTIAHILFTQER